MSQELAPGAEVPPRPAQAPGPPPPASGRAAPDADPAAVIARARAVWEDYRQTWNRPAGEPRPSDTMMAISACLAAERLPEILPLAEEAADLRALFDLQQTRVQAATERWRAEAPAERAGVLPDMGRLLDWLMADADRLRRELDRWESGQRSKGLPVVESVPDGVTYAARLLHAQGTEGGDEHDDLLRSAAERLKQLSDAASHLLAEAMVLRAAGRYDDAVAALRDIQAYGRWWSEQDTTMTVTLGPWALRAAADYLDAVRESRIANQQSDEHPEAHCHRCGRPNLPWVTPSPLWNQVMRGGDINAADLHDGIVCPTCFAALAEAAGIARDWRLTAADVQVPLPTVTPSGRVWDAGRWLWVDPDDTTAGGTDGR